MNDETNDPVKNIIDQIKSVPTKGIYDPSSPFREEGETVSIDDEIEYLMANIKEIYNDEEYTRRIQEIEDIDIFDLVPAPPIEDTTTDADFNTYWTDLYKRSSSSMTYNTAVLGKKVEYLEGNSVENQSKAAILEIINDKMNEINDQLTNQINNANVRIYKYKSEVTTAPRDNPLSHLELYSDILPGTEEGLKSLLEADDKTNIVNSYSGDVDRKSDLLKALESITMPVTDEDIKELATEINKLKTQMQEQEDQKILWNDFLNDLDKHKNSYSPNVRYEALNTLAKILKLSEEFKDDLEVVGNFGDELKKLWFQLLEMIFPKKEAMAKKYEKLKINQDQYKILVEKIGLNKDLRLDTKEIQIPTLNEDEMKMRLAKWSQKRLKQFGPGDNKSTRGQTRGQ